MKLAAYTVTLLTAAPSGVYFHIHCGYGVVSWYWWRLWPFYPLIHLVLVQAAWVDRGGLDRLGLFVVDSRLEVVRINEQAYGFVSGVRCHVYCAHTCAERSDLWSIGRFTYSSCPSYTVLHCGLSPSVADIDYCDAGSDIIWMVYLHPSESFVYSRCTCWRLFIGWVVASNAQLGYYQGVVSGYYRRHVDMVCYGYRVRTYWRVAPKCKLLPNFYSIVLKTNRWG